MLPGPRAAWALGGGLFLVTWVLWATGGLMYLWAVSQIFFTTQKMQSDIREIEALGRPNPAFARELQVEGTKGSSGSKPGYVALSYHHALHENRSVTVQAQVPLSDLLEPGESLPEPALLDAFAQARAARLADAECRLVDQVLAKQCVVRDSHGDPDDDGLARISMTLGFVQKSPFGDLPAGPRAAYVETNDPVGRPQRVSLAAAPEARARAYAEVADLCDRLRTAEGNCAIAHVMVGTTIGSFTGGSAEFSVRARLSSLTALPG